MNASIHSEGKNGLRLLTVQDAAQMLAVSVSTLYGWVWQRKIPFVKMGRALRFSLDDLEKFIEANRTAIREDSLASPAPKRCYNRGAAGKG